MSWLLSEAASQGANGPGAGRMAVKPMVRDFKRAFLYADVQRELYIEVPTNDERNRNGGWAGRLRKATYGTQDAPAAWQREVRRMLLRKGFQSSRIMPCFVFNLQTGISLIAHADDLLVVGPLANLELFREDLQKDFEVDGHIFGRGPGCTTEIKFLGRTLRFTNIGLEWESDPR